MKQIQEKSILVRVSVSFELPGVVQIGSLFFGITAVEINEYRNYRRQESIKNCVTA